MTGPADGETPITGALRALSASFCQQLGRPFGRDPLHRVPPAQARVRLAVGHVRPEAAVADHDLPPGRRILAQLAERPARGSSPAAARWLSEELLGLVQRDREELLLALERARLGAFLDIRAVAPVLRGHLLAVELADYARQRQEPQRVVERHRLG